MVPTAKATALPGDSIDRGGDHFETLRPKRLREVRHVVADDDCLLIQHKTIAAKLLLRVFGRNLDQLPVLEKLRNPFDKRFLANHCQPRTRQCEHAVKVKEVVAQRHLVHPVPVAEQILQPPNSGRVGCVPRVTDVDVATHQQNIPAFQERSWPVLAVLVDPETAQAPASTPHARCSPPTDRPRSGESQNVRAGDSARTSPSR